MKVVFQGLILVFLFLGLWFIMTKVDWINLFRIEKLTEKTEQKLGNIFWNAIANTENELTEKEVVLAVDSMLSKVCIANNINSTNIKMHLIIKDEVNAFALPGGHLVIYTGLIKKAENPEELLGVICHELAHIELQHVKKKLLKEVGLSVLLSITTGNTGTEIIQETVKQLSSSSFDRKLEKEADIKSVEYLYAANIDPKPFSKFLNRIAEENPEMDKLFSWISTHPDSKERARYVLEYCQKLKGKFVQIMPNEAWNQLKQTVAK